MQSDKHLYNARSLQQRQQEQMRQGGSGSSAFPLSSQNNDTKVTQSEARIWDAYSMLNFLSKNEDWLVRLFFAEHCKTSCLENFRQSGV